MARDNDQIVFGHERLGKIYPKGMLKSLETKEEKVIRYDKKNLPIGVDNFNRPYILNFEHPTRILIIGKPRSGKSWILHALADRLAFFYAVIYLNDCKREFYTSRFLLQEQYRHLLLPGEKPRRRKVISLRPTIFEKMDGGILEEYDHWYSENPSTLKKVDLMTLLDVPSISSQATKNCFQLLFEEMEKEFEGREKEFRIEWLFEKIEMMEDWTDSQKTAVKMRIKPLMTSNFYKPENEIDIVELMKKGFIPAINFKKFDEFYGSNFNPPPVLYSLILRKVANARVKKEIPEVWVLIDEAERFLSSERESCSRFQTIETVGLSASSGMSLVICSQLISRLPKEIVSQCRYTFIPYNIDIPTLTECLKLCGALKTQQNAYNEARRLKSQMGKWQWIVIDRDNPNKTITIIRALPPLSHHKESRE
ncbi:MAG TPA: hypothetical protein VJ044_13830 [Candidatus Hodarchaeales archaeon]|nr:hypothetical protein [Candidatus Hodarchaeales archaeon]